MIDERTQQMIEYYLPNPPDPELADDEYYYLQYTKSGSQAIRVFALDILPCKDGVEYGIYRKHGSQLQRIDTGYGDPNRGCRKHDLYDNRQDCIDQTHMMADDWEELRAIQKEAEHADAD